MLAVSPPPPSWSFGVNLPHKACKRREQKTPVASDFERLEVCLADARLLVALIRSCCPLVVDVRSFFIFTVGHIAEAINISLPRALTRRRPISLSEVEGLFSDERSRTKFRHRHGRSIIIYDDCDDGGSSYRPATVLYKLLSEEMEGSVRMLTGGFKAFAKEYPELCSLPEEERATAATHSHSHSHSHKSQKNTPTIALPPMTFQAACPEGPTEIIPGLFLGANKDAACKKHLQRHNITYIVNMAKECPNHFPDEFHYVNVPLEDCSSQKISDRLRDLVALIASAQENEEAVLVHCYAGVSRSTTVVLAYLVARAGMSLSAAYDLCVARRPIVAPNSGFLMQLIRHEVSVRGACSLPDSKYGPLIQMALDDDDDDDDANDIPSPMDMSTASNSGSGGDSPSPSAERHAFRAPCSKKCADSSVFLSSPLACPSTPRGGAAPSFASMDFQDFASPPMTPRGTPGNGGAFPSGGFVAF